MTDTIVPTGAIVPPGRQAKPQDVIIPEGEISPPTWGDTAIDAAKSVGAGALRGAAALADLPGDISQLVSAGSKKLTGYGTPTIDFGAREAMADLTGGFSERKPQTTTGRYAGTIGEFVPGAIATALTGGGSLGANILRGAVAPAIGSELAGSLAAGSDSQWAEPAARIAGAILGGMSGNVIEGGLRRAISPSGGANPADLAKSEYLKSKGIPVSASQETQSGVVRGIEANNPAMQAMTAASPDSPQLQALTTAALKMAGLTDDVVARVQARPNFTGNPRLANPEVMDELNSTIGRRFDDALRGATVQPSQGLYTTMRAALSEINPPNMPPGTANRAVPTPLLRLFGEWNTAIRAGGPMDAQRLQSLRSQLGDYLSSGDPAVVSAARSVRDAIDEAIENGVAAMGQPDRMRALLEAREQYRNYLAIEKAIKVNTDFGVNGVVRPQELAAAAAQTQGKRAATTGRGTEINRLAQSGVDVLKPVGNMTRTIGGSLLPIGEIVGGGLSGFGIMQGGNMLNLPPSLSIGSAALVAGAGGIDAARRVARQALENRAASPIVQSYLRNQLLNSTTGTDALSTGIRGAASGALSSRQERKAGGRVSSHEADADQLVRAAERAKKGWSAQTEPLLNHSDEHIVHALDVANRSI